VGPTSKKKSFMTIVTRTSSTTVVLGKDTLTPTPSEYEKGSKQRDVAGRLLGTASVNFILLRPVFPKASNDSVKPRTCKR
jgi:hypothetical protein